MELPIYKIAIDLDDETTGMTAISLVEYPAIESNFLVFNKERNMMFSIQDEMEHKITGCAIWADKPIYRYDYSIGEYYVVFDKDTIEDIVLKYSKQGLNNLVDLQHNGEMIGGVTMVEYYIKDSEKGISPKGFDDVADGSLFCTYKVEDEDLWKQITDENSEFRGFSIEINAEIVPTDMTVTVEDEPSLSEDDKFWEELLQWLGCLSSEKKKFSVERSDIARIIDRRKTVMAEIGDDKAVEYAVHSLGKKNGQDAAILYDVKDNRWSVVPLKDIKAVVPTKTNITEMPALPDEIVEDDDITIQRTIDSATYSDLIHNRTMVMLTYNDELPNPSTAYRQLAIVAWGITMAGNECIRVMQLTGDSRSVKEGENYLPNYRLMLTKRIQSFKPMENTEPWPVDILDDRYNWNGDKSMKAVYDHCERSDFND